MLQQQGKKKEKIICIPEKIINFLVNANQSSYLQPSGSRADINEPHLKIEFQSVHGLGNLGSWDPLPIWARFFHYTYCEERYRRHTGC